MLHGLRSPKHFEPDAFDNDAIPNNLPATTKWYRAHGRPSRREKAAKEQYLNPQEEESLVRYVLRISRNGYPLPVKILRSLAFVIRRQRVHDPMCDSSLQPPGKNWPQGFYRRNTELKARKSKAMDWKRHDFNIYDKVVEWFSVVQAELTNPAILQENVYNMDETGILLSLLGSLKVLVGREDLRNYRGASSQRTLITAIECISAGGRYLPPLIVWPAATHRSTWTVHPTPGWHFACSETGYTNNAISLYWVQHVFEPLTRPRADGRPRVLISDGFATHESLEIMTFCFSNNIILCRLPSHTSHKLQPCDIAVFGPLKTAYREQVEQLFRGGAAIIGKQHFTLLYSRAREVAFTARNIRAGWSKAGLYPFNPDRVLSDLSIPPVETAGSENNMNMRSHALSNPLRTPTTSRSLDAMRSQLEETITTLDKDAQPQLKKLLNGAVQGLATCALLTDENRRLLEQNSERKERKRTRATVVGRAKIMSYEDIVQAQKQRKNRDVDKAQRAVRKYKRKSKAPAALRMDEVDKAEREIRAAGLSEYCSVLRF